MVDTLETFTSEALFGLDIAFVIDATGSMISYISGAKNSIIEIMNESKSRFKKYKAEESMLRFGIVAYRDHPPQENSFVTLIRDFSNFSTASCFLDKLSATGGGDPPEAVLDGLHDAVTKLSWNDNTEKLIFLLLDNPGHGIRFGTNYDCPCNLHEKEILSEMARKQISFHIIKPKIDNDKLDKMIDCFKQHIDLEITELEKISKLKYRRTKYIRDKSFDSIETENNDRVKYKTSFKIEGTNKKYIFNTEVEDKTRREIVISNIKQTNRNRSRSISNNKDNHTESSTIPIKQDLSILSTLSTLSSKDELYKPIENNNYIISNDKESREFLENGISEIITKTVLLKLDQQLKSLSNSQNSK